MDAAYLERLDGRLGRLEHNEITTRQDIAHAKEELSRVQGGIGMELASLELELAALDDEVHATVERIKLTMAAFKTVSKKGDLQRLQSRIDAWAPEQKITKKQFLRLLQDV